MHAIDEVAVQVSCLAEHHRVALGLAAVGMRGGIARALICLDFGNPDEDLDAIDAARHERAEERRCHPDRGPGQLRPPDR
jgi:hypothetical protein